MMNEDQIRQRIKELERWEKESPTNSGQGELQALKWVVGDNKILNAEQISDALHAGETLEDQYGNTCYMNKNGDFVKSNKTKTQIQVGARLEVGNRWRIVDEDR